MKVVLSAVLPFVLTALATCVVRTEEPPGSTSSLPLMPWPAEISLATGPVSITPDFSVSISGSGAADSRVQMAVARIFPRLNRQTGILTLPHVVSPGKGATMEIVVESRDHKAPQRLGDDERYSLRVSDGRIRLSANAPLGVVRGVETFLQLIQPNSGPGGSPGYFATAVQIRDQPRFLWRGLSLDVSRHFVPPDQVKRTLDGLAAVKLNVFHWHLSDDQGFRIESRRYPRLHQFGSDGLFYTQAEVRDVIAYARERGIRVVPEFDIPGHATSWLAAYPSLGTTRGPFEVVHNVGVLTALMDPTKESTYRFLDGFVGEMAKLFPDDYFHIGGDEVNPKQWNESPTVRRFMQRRHIADWKALQTYFNARLLKIVVKHGKHMEGWDEVLHADLPKSTVIQSWRGQESLWQAARQGYRGILSAGYYLDLMYPASYHYAVDPMVLPPERVERLRKQNQPIPADLAPQETRFILGGEAAMWEELATSENLDAKLWPRLAAIAERLWSPQTITDPASMYARLDAVNLWLEWLGLTQRSNLELMRRRLAGPASAPLLARFSEVLEPVKGYSRHAQRYGTFTPLNTLVDSIPPESDAARHFREAVDKFLFAGSTGMHDTAAANALASHLRNWSEASAAVRPVFQSNPNLADNLPVAEALISLCQMGIDALRHLSSNGASAPVTDEWKKHAADTVKQMSERKGDLLIQIAPGIQKLVDAVSAPTP